MPYIDAFTHFFPRQIFDAMFGQADVPDIGKRMKELAALSDLDARLRLIETIPDYRQVISLGMPPIEEIADAGCAPDLARLANDSQSETVAMHPDHFFGYAGALPMNDPEAAAREIERIAADPLCVGIQIHTSILGEPLDHPRFAPVFEAASRAGMAVLLHPTRRADLPDYPSEEFSRYEVWQVLGWPYETSVAMARLVLSGMMDTYPGIRVVTHHLGAMMPFFEGRVGWKSLGTRSTGEDYSGVLERLKKPPVDYFKDFYGDTAITLTRGAFLCGFEFFGPERVIFATDCPFPNGRDDRMRNIVGTITAMPIPEKDKERIFHRNALSLFDRASRQ